MEELDIEDDIELYEQILAQINSLTLTTEEIDTLLTSGFLHTIERKHPEVVSIRGFKEILSVEQLANEIEQDGNFVYQNVLDEINRRLSMNTIPDDQRKALVAMKNVYENDFFRQGKENSKILQDQQKINNEIHSAKQITEDLLEIGRSGTKEKTLQEFVGIKEKGQETKEERN